ncbi:(Fe-S)-binding protein [Algoriphagus algorifonticola]|uniref:(Fe-S)-binding protein n=1 Tax=Algoriphagus algorifonticola TaxID=2593007 RepID=UPI0011A6689F|nr:(Fe-S)-binding protein [Algoriphagus algorifonticola]
MAQTKPHVGLFIPCYVDQFYPQVGKATLEILEKLNCNVSYPLNQTCCGQPLANSGYERDTKDACQHFLSSFLQFDFIVSPSGSCVHHVKERYPKILHDPELQSLLDSKIFELTEFLHDILSLEIQGTFSHKVGYHASCHALRGLGLSKSSEVNTAPFDKVKSLFEKVEGLEWSQLQRSDECCGFGGTFSVKEEAISLSMGKDRLTDHHEAGTEILTATDMSCLMHLQAIEDKNQSSLPVMHLAEIINQIIS